MNRQTMLVIAGTLGLVVFGALALYSTPRPTPGTVATPGAAVEAKAGKRGPKGKVPAGSLRHSTPIGDRAAAPDGAPNVVLVIASAVRRDQVAPYGGAADAMPFLLERAQAGVVFADALTTAPSSRPALASIVTGRHPHEVDLVETGPRENKRILAPEHTTLAERFAASGYFTVGATGNHNLNTQTGLAQGFDVYTDAQPASLALPTRVSGGTVVERGLAPLEERPEGAEGRPFFLQLVVIDSHKPFRVPPSEFKVFEGPDHTIAPYRATLKRTDNALAALAEGLGALGHTDADTVFVFVGEEGEGLSMPEHHRKQHGRVLYPSSVSVPLVVWGKGAKPGHRVQGLSLHTDLAPTLLGLAGLDIPEGAFSGHDWSAQVQGTQARTTRASAYVDTWYQNANRASLFTDTLACQRDYGSEGIEDDSFEDGCFDRERDPEFTDPSDDEAVMAELEKQRAALLQHLE